MAFIGITILIDTAEWLFYVTTFNEKEGIAMTRAMRSQTVRTLSSCLVVILLFTGQPLFANTHLPAWDTFAGQFIEHYLSMHPSFAANAGRHKFDGKLSRFLLVLRS